MKYALKLDKDNRILSAWEVLPNRKYVDMILTDILPEGDIYNYIYNDGEYIYNPLPKEEEEETPSNEERIAELEKALSLLLEGATE